jgi:mannosyltransferase OCH1-like enzyme
MYITLVFIVLILIMVVFVNSTETYLPSSDCKFPKRIFQTWKSKTVIPKNMQYWMDSWKLYNPSYIHELWDDNDNRNFIILYFPWFLNTFDSYDVNIKRVDAVRYFYLYKYGGIYVERDFECLKSFDDLLIDNETESDIILGKMNSGTHEHNVPNAIMISKQKQEFWIVVFYLLMTLSGQVEHVTGPVMLKKAYHLYTTTNVQNTDWYKDLLYKLHESTFSKCSVKLMEPHVFYPVDWTNAVHQNTLRKAVVADGEIYDSAQVARLFPDSLAVTYWTHTW